MYIMHKSTVYKWARGSGGNITDMDGYRYHKFLSSDLFTCVKSGDVEYLIVAGGAAINQHGGIGTLSSITGTAIIRAGGTNGTNNNTAASHATANTGSGGGGGGWSGTTGASGGNGASGIIILRYKIY